MKTGHRRQKAADSRQQGRNNRAAFHGLLFVVLCLIFLGGCGKKGDPRAPELATPQTIKDLRGRPDKGGIALAWTRPTQYVDGKALSDLAGFVIFRKEISKSCPDCPVPYREQATVNVEDQEKFMKKKQYGFVDKELKPQTTYRYRIFSKLMDNSLSDPSNEIEVAWKP